MVVFEYFYDKMDIFGPKMNEMATRFDLEMEDMEEVCLSISASVYLSVCLSVCFLSVSESQICPCDAISPTCPQSFSQELAPQPPSPDAITRSLLLAISVCYHARLQDREDYEEGVTAQFVAPLGLPGGAAQFRDEIQWYTHNVTQLPSHLKPCRKIS